MRIRRMIPKETAIYHCMSRTINGEAYFGSTEKETLRKMIGKVADFSGVEVLTYCVMSNHFHVLIRVSPVEELPDSELLRRFKVLYPKPTDFQVMTSDDLARILAAGGDSAIVVRAQLLARMGDVSQFMKTLKQRFSIWFNKSRDRYGPVWSDRFKSVLVEGQGFALQTVAAYIDLNPVRAGLVDDPKDYRFCGYGEAVGGGEVARAGIHIVIGGEDTHSMKAAMQSYRQLLFGKGSAPAIGAAGIARADAVRVLEQEDGDLPAHVLLRCRIRYFTEGAVLGSKAFVEAYVRSWQINRGRKHPPKIHSVSAASDIDGDHTLNFLNACRGNPFV